jgi:hypothetical protein
MPVQDSPRRAGPYQANGTQTAFPFAFRVLMPEHMRVVIADTAGLETVVTSGYTVTFNSDQTQTPGGTVKFDIAPQVDSRIVLTSDAPYEQVTDFQNLGGFYAEDHTKTHDRTAIQIQQLAEQADRAIKMPITGDETPEDFAQALLESGDKAITAAAQAEAAAKDAVQAAGEAKDAADFAQEAVDLIGGKFTISTSPPSGGKDGDVWFWVSQ